VNRGPHRRLRGALASVVVALLVALLVPVVATGASAVADPQCATPKGVYAGPPPWAQNLLDPARIWSMSNGSGVLVAVLGTGVDPGNAQFSAGQVLPEIDLLAGGPGAPDCDGQGTFAAGIVAAQTNPATTFAGLAPGVRILPVRYAQSGTPAGGGDPNLLATAIDKAVAEGAGVILIMVPADTDSNTLQLAVQNANAAGDVVVAPAVGDQADATSYPTATPGVIGVGALGQTGLAVQQEAGSYIAVAAPAANLVGTAAGARGQLGQSWPVTAPAYAAAYVAGAVALLRSYRPMLDPAQVGTRLILTASHPGSTGHDPRLGWGVLNAYAALSTDLPANAVAPTIGASGRVAPRTQAPAKQSSLTEGIVGLLVLLGIGLVGIIVAVLTALRRGRARGWWLRAPR
jgi:hypothetical protein